MAQPFSEVQTAIVARLQADSGVQAAMTAYTEGASYQSGWNIFDDVPENEPWPYIYVGDMQGRIGSASAIGPGGTATDILLTIHIFSQYAGWKEGQGIVSAIDDALNQKAFGALPNGFNNFFLLFDNYIPVPEPDSDITRHGALRYRLRLTG